MRRLRHILPNVPGAGQEFSYVIPESIPQARVVSFTARLTTSIIVDNRIATLRVTDRSGNVRLIAPSATLQVGSTVIDYVWGLGGTPYSGGGDPLFEAGEVVPLIDCWVQGGDVLRTVTVNRDAGDLWTAPYLTLELDG